MPWRQPLIMCPAASAPMWVSMEYVTKTAVFSKDPASADVDVLVVGLDASASEPRLIGVFGKKFISDFTTVAKAVGPKTTAGDITRLHVASAKATTVITVGVDGGADASAAALRDAAASAIRSIVADSAADTTVRVALALPGADVASAAATALGGWLGAYQFNGYRDSETVDIELVIATEVGGKELDAALERARIVADAVNGTRDLVNVPPNDLYPESFAERAKEITSRSSIKVQVYADKELRNGGFGGLLAVGQGSTRGPRLVKLTYSPGKAKQHIALVGKGITFDSGGLSLKPAKSMETMKIDMAGAAAVLHAINAVARLGLPIAVTGWLCLAENMPGGAAQRPSDVITIHDGTTVEVLNTDAEGRLVLADGLSAAVEEEPDAVIDIATLTGAQMVALGNRVAAAMGDDDLRGEVVRAAEAAGERLWPMPLPADLRPSLKSKVADIANIGERMGGMAVAGLFLKEFVDETPWAHLDIAGPAFNEGSPYQDAPTGGTGYGVRTLIEFLEGRLT